MPLGRLDTGMAVTRMGRALELKDVIAVEARGGKVTFHPHPVTGKMVAVESNGATVSFRTNTYERGELEVMLTTHEGLVLDTRESNGYDDSDFYAIVWNTEKGAPEEVMYATTRGWTYMNGASVDATPEVRAAYEAYLDAKRVEDRRIREEAEARIPSRGRSVKVVKGRKIPKGTTGEVIWYGEGKHFSYGKPPMRVGIKTETGEVLWTDAKNVEVMKLAA